MTTDPILGLAIALAVIAWAVTITGRRATRDRLARESHADTYIAIYGVEAVAEYVERCRVEGHDLDLANDLEAALDRANARAKS